ncbi:stress responsive A/B barrel domain-containing protein [Plectosphaerella cucumerina]|uniref:Stress responsive A/B barrel domain-containing protein n=1 Tax=Plectosphaerella cucumerina TaxID=40658 RepID=A0A8K0TJ30_9PEZI|nr:stress responsive A/B barrel domain-containing protein [Plectosphaerella cucumerina]
MTLIHIVLFKFRADVSAEHKAAFVTELRTLRELPCVQNRNLWVGSPSVTRPIEKSQGFEIALVSFHDGLEALEVYQASKEHERITHTMLWPYKEDVVRFDFEVPGDDALKVAGAMSGLGKLEE